MLESVLPNFISLLYQNQGVGDIVVGSSGCSSVCCGVDLILVYIVGVSLSDSVFLPSIIIGLVVLLYISMLLFLMDARVGGGQLLDLLASTSISWSGRFVLTDR